MEPIKPIDGIRKDTEEQTAALAGAIRDRYWQQRAQTTPAVESTKETSRVTERRQNEDKEKSSIQTHRTYAEFEVNQETGEVLVRIIEAESGKLVRTIPPDELVKEIIKGNFRPNQLRRRAI
ncbi:MAG: flagellar protein FlaG [Anaerolineae bacterium]